MERENLHKHLHRLTRKERAVLVRIVQSKPEWQHYHIGMLPFIPRVELCVWMAHLEVNGYFQAPPRFLKQIYSKISLGAPTGDIIELDDGKVFRRFGKHPERGVCIPGIPTTHKKRERKPFERKKDAYDVQQTVVSLKRISPNRWMLQTREGVRNRAIQWLTDNLR